MFSLPLARTASVLALTLTGWTLAAHTGRAAAPAGGVAAITRWGFDEQNTHWNSSETALTPSAVRSSSFGKVREYPVDGQVYAQPLYQQGVATGKGTRNLVFVATEHNSVYAFDADAADSAPVWQISLGASVPSGLTNCGLLSPEIGITSTPVLDPDTSTLYVVAKLLENGAQTNRIFALDARTGAQRPGWGVALAASVPAVDSGAVILNNEIQFCRCGLALRNGRVYLALSSHCDNRISEYHGWVLAYNTANPTEPPLAWCATPLAKAQGDAAGGIWMSGAAPALDTSGNLYLLTGNGPLEVDRGKPLVSDSFVKLTTQGGAALLFGGTPADYFAPSNQPFLESVDGDFGSGGPLLITETAKGRAMNLALGGGKDALLRLLNRDSLGGFKGRTNPKAKDAALQDYRMQGGLFSTPSYWGSGAGHFVYASGVNGPLVQLQVKPSGSKFKLVKVAATKMSTGYPSSTPAISSNGTTAGTGVLWMLNRNTGALHAFDAGRISRELYNSNQNRARDGLDSVTKFTTPLLANGRVYVGTDTRLVIYGRLTP